MAAAVTAVLVARSPVLMQPRSTGILRGLIVASYAAVGAYTWWRRPASRLGPLIAGLAFLFALTSLDASGSSAEYSLGRLCVTAMLVALVYVALCFPRDRLGSRFERRFVSLFVLASLVSWLLVLLLAERLPPAGPFAACAGSCPHNAFQVVETSSGVTSALDALAVGISVSALLVVAVLLLRKARSPLRLRRRAVLPLLVAFAVLAVSLAGFITLRHALGADGASALRAIAAASVLAIPVGLLVGQIRGNAFAARSVGTIAVRASSESLDVARVQTLIADALGDPTLTLAIRVSQPPGFVDVRGAPVVLPDDPAERAFTPVRRDGRTVAALIHDPALDTDPGVLEGLAATSLMLLENIRLVEELRASRGRLVASSERERLRLERDLHDGAQQHLMAIQVKLALLEDEAAGGHLAEKLEEVRADAAEAVEELRRLAHGIYPTVLRERGLADALRSLAMTAPLPIEVRDGGIGRCSAEVEGAIYFCSLEAIQNAIKHAGPGAHVTVTLERRNGNVEFEVADDGAGIGIGASPDGVGMTSTRDRVGAVGGQLEVVSSPGQGARIRGTVPDEAGRSGEGT